MMKRSFSQIRTDSRAALAGNYSVCFIVLFFLFMVNTVISHFLYVLPLPAASGFLSVLTDILYSLPGSLVLTMLQAGFLFLSLNIARYGRPSFSDVFLAFRYDPGRAAGLCAVIALIDIICSLPFSYALTDLLVSMTGAFYGEKSAPILSSLGLLLLNALISLALNVVFAFPFSQALMLYIDHQEYSATDCLVKSRELMRGHIIHYLMLFLSFAGYLALAMVSLGVGLIWVIPYICVSRANFYMDLTGTYKPY